MPDLALALDTMSLNVEDIWDTDGSRHLTAFLIAAGSTR